MEVLAGGGPEDVVELTVRLAEEMLACAGVRDADPAGRPQGRPGHGRLEPHDRGAGRGPRAPNCRWPGNPRLSTRPADGVLVELDALSVGVAAWRLGAGRARKEDRVQAGAGVRMHAKPGAVVRAGEPLMTLLTDTPEKFARAKEALEHAVVIAPEGSRPAQQLIIDRIA